MEQEIQVDGVGKLSREQLQRSIVVRMQKAINYANDKDFLNLHYMLYGAGVLHSMIDKEKELIENERATERKQLHRESCMSFNEFVREKMLTESATADLNLQVQEYVAKQLKKKLAKDAISDMLRVKFRTAFKGLDEPAAKKLARSMLQTAIKDIKDQD